MTEMEEDRRFHKLTQEQVETLDQVLTEVIPIHGRGNFPTLEIKPKDIIHVVRDRLMLKKIKVKDVRLNGSTASHVLVKENGTSYKDLDIIFGVELPKPEDFQVIKEVVLSCLLDFLPKGVNKDKITALTMKEAYVQKMVKVFTEHDRWSLISLSNNSGKNVELKFVNSLRRQFEFSVDSFQIILDSMLQSYLDAEKREAMKERKDQDSSSAKKKLIPSGLQEQLISSCDTGHQEKSDVEMSCKMDASVRDSTAQGNENENEKTTHLEEAPTFESNEDEKVIAESAMMTVSIEQESELSETVTLKDNPLHSDLTLKGSEQEEVMDSGSADQGDAIKTLLPEEIKSETDPDKPEYMLDIEPVNSQTWLEVVHTKFSCVSSKGTFSDRCTFRPAPITIVKQSSLDSFAEYPLPPPAKRNSHNSQMVVLKHSSPKPPRKMSKKTSPVQCSLEKTDSDGSHVLKPPTDHQKESLPMQESLPSGIATKSLDISSASQQDSKESKDLDTCDGTASESSMDSEESVNKSVSHEESFLSHSQSSEQEMDGVTHVTSNPKSCHHVILRDQKSIGHPTTETLPTAQCQAKVPLINVNSKPLLQANDTSCLNLASSKSETDSCTHVEDPTSTKLLLPSSESITKSKQCSSQMTKPLKTKIPSVSQVVDTNEHSSLQKNFPRANSQTQEHLLQSPQKDVLEPLVCLPKVQSLAVSGSDFLPSPEPSITTTQTLEIQRTTETLAEPTGLLLDFINTSEDVEPLQVLSVVQESSKLEGPASSEIEMAVTNPSGTSATIIHEETLPSTDPPFVTVLAESMYGDFEQAMEHLRYRLIATRNPEEIRGGGLLKYSNLLVRDFKPACETEIKTLERYMCSRFFIDFPDVNDQQRKIESYLRNHFIGEEKSKYDYLMTLRRVVNESTVCLMGHERRQTLNMITILALKVLGEQNIIPNANNVTCYYQPAPYMADHNFSNYYISNGQSPLIYHPYPLHIHMQTGLV